MAKKAAEQPVESKIVAAVGVATSGPSTDLSKRVEAAMSKAVLDANAEGISVEQSDIIRERMMQARQAVLDEHAQQQLDAMRARMAVGGPTA